MRRALQGLSGMLRSGVGVEGCGRVWVGCSGGGGRREGGVRGSVWTLGDDFSGWCRDGLGCGPMEEEGLWFSAL